VPEGNCHPDVDPLEEAAVEIELLLLALVDSNSEGEWDTNGEVGDETRLALRRSVEGTAVAT
jgi:hypothetical protein